jgi:hypothetical protein
MYLNLDDEQRSQLELISIHLGKPPAQAVMDAVYSLLQRDVEFWESAERPQQSQRFLAEDALGARFARMLRR